MGTNFYITTKNKFSARKNFLDEYELTDEFGDLCYSVHICKRSAGWSPLFEIHKNFKTFKELEEFYIKNSSDYMIFDEYGKEYDWKTFKQEMIDHSNIEPEPLKWVYKYNPLFDYVGRKSLYTEECDPDEADIWAPFDHKKYQDSYNAAMKKYNHSLPFSISFDDLCYFRDPDYKFDWVEGSFS